MENQYTEGDWAMLCYHEKELGLPSEGSFSERLESIINNYKNPKLEIYLKEHLKRHKGELKGLIGYSFEEKPWRQQMDLLMEFYRLQINHLEKEIQAKIQDSNMVFIALELILRTFEGHTAKVLLAKAKTMTEVLEQANAVVHERRPSPTLHSDSDFF